MVVPFKTSQPKSGKVVCRFPHSASNHAKPLHQHQSLKYFQSHWCTCNALSEKNLVVPPRNFFLWVFELVMFLAVQPSSALQPFLFCKFTLLHFAARIRFIASGEFAIHRLRVCARLRLLLSWRLSYLLRSSS